PPWSPAGAALAWLQEGAATRAATTVKGQLRTRLLTHVVRLGPGWLTGRRSGELTTLATRGLDALDGYFARYLPHVVLAALVPAASVRAGGGAGLVPADPVAGRTGRAARRPGPGPAARLGGPAAPGPTDPGRRARCPALRRAAPAPGPRPGAAGRSSGPRAGRADRAPGRADRAGADRQPARRGRRPHRGAGDPPALRAGPRRPDRPPPSRHRRP